MDNLRAAKRILEQTTGWHITLKAIAHALVAIADALRDEEVDDPVDEFTATGNVYDLADLHEKNRGLMNELDRMRSRLTQCTLENERLEKWIEQGTRGGTG